jgi:hypothetical protein
MRTPEMQAVESSSIEAVGYDSKDREIYIRFLNGATYAYGESDQSTFEELLSASSIGSYVNRVIKPRCPCRPL